LLLIAFTGFAWAQDAPALPDWFTLHGEQRARYETSDRRYRPGESGGDQQLAFRTRLQMGVKGRNFWIYSEAQDSRAALTDSGSTVNTQHVSNTHVQQLHAGYRLEKVFRLPVSLSVEAGRFSRDFGGRRQIGRNNFRNTTNAFDGVIVKVEQARWSLQAFHLRPMAYLGQENARLNGLFFSGKADKVSFDFYTLHLKDRERSFYSSGARLYGSLGRVDYEAESIMQRGRQHSAQHSAWMQHAQAGYRWGGKWRPITSLLYDYASGDRDPNDNKNNAFDSLYGPRRFEFGPTGTWGIYARSNLNSPAAQILVRPSSAMDLSVQHRLFMMAQAKDQWRGVGLTDPTGKSGSYIGQQTEYRVRYRWGKYFEVDSGLVLFREGSFIRSVRNQMQSNWARYYFIATEWKF
jgi:hypothetical protein